MWGVMVKITNKYGVPDAIMNFQASDKYSRGQASYSVTQLIDAPQIRLLREKHGEEIEVDVSERLWALLGTAIHAVLEEHSGEGETPEERLYAEVQGVTISGQIDVQRADGNTLAVEDYKTTSVWAVMNGKQEWELQLNVYAWLAEKVKGIPVTKAAVVAIMRDWSKAESKRTPDYPASPIQVVEIPVWPMEERERYINERVAHQFLAETNAAMGLPLPPCSDQERWLKPPKYAIVKEGNSRATKVCDTLEEAEKLLVQMNQSKGRYVIQERPATPIRCAEDYCQVARWCGQWQQQKVGKDVDD